MHRCRERTRGTETSKYPQEKKETSIPQVAASESGSSPNRDSSRGCGRLKGLQRSTPAEAFERRGTEGNTPVREELTPRCEAFQSSTELVELRVNPGGPPPKAKYSSVTDSEEVR